VSTHIPDSKRQVIASVGGGTAGCKEELGHQKEIKETNFENRPAIMQNMNRDADARQRARSSNWPEGFEISDLKSRILI
jgi:hypothetical protein